jgi:hypothetical protein
MKSTILVVAVLLAVVGASFAGTAQGEKEIGGLIAYMSPDEGDDMTFAQVFGGYFLTDAWQARLALSAFSVEGDISGTVGLGADYHFVLDNPDIVPYAGALLTTGYGDIDSGTQVDLHVGAKLFVSEGTAFNASVSYLKGSDASTTMALLGISVFL